MKSSNISFNTRKSLCNHLGESAGNEVADLLQHLASRVDHVEQNKVDVTRIIPTASEGNGRTK